MRRGSNKIKMNKNMTTTESRGYENHGKFSRLYILFFLKKNRRALKRNPKRI